MSGGNMKEMDLPTHGVDLLTVGLRAYVQPSTEVRAAGRRRGRRNLAGPSEWLLCFDTETTTDPSQRLRFGTYQVRRIGEPYEQGIFHDPDALTEAEWDLIWSYAAKHGLKLLTLAEFVEQVFFGIGYDLRATIIGFNLSFDISRLANRWSSARKRMREGFTFQLSGNKERPRVRVKYISRRLAFIGFAAIARQRTWRSERRRGERIPPRRGFFIDVKTIAAALLSRPSLTLKSLAGLLKTPNQKKTSEEHGGPISDEYLDYAVQDVQVTWECYRELASRYQQWGLKRPLHKIYSEASLGKAIMAEMRIRPWRDVQPDFPHELLGWIWSTYFGGRAEVNIRRVVTRVRHCDFLSMYATICTLLTSR